MTVDDFVKIILVLSVAIAIVGIALQLMRVLGGVADNLQDLRKAVQNVGKITDMAVEDYGKLRGLVTTLADLGDKLKNIAGPVSALLSKLPVGKDRTPQ